MKILSVQVPFLPPEEEFFAVDYAIEIGFKDNTYLIAKFALGSLTLSDSIPSTTHSLCSSPVLVLFIFISLPPTVLEPL
jgi:hypothetical protein